MATAPSLATRRSGSAALVAVLLCALTPRCIVSQEGIEPTSYLKMQGGAPSYHVQDVWAAHAHLPNYEQVQQAAGDTFDYLPKEYLRDYRNPCWRRDPPEAGPDGPAAFKCLPYFQILGVSKCGTTDLYHRLTANPDMVECAWKGPHFWDESNYPANRKSDKYDGSFPAYVRIFDKPASKIEKRASAVTGEASSNTFTGVLTYTRGVRWPRTLNVTLAQLLWEATPWARFIVLMRDPVSRYYSAYHYYRPKSMGKGSPEEFHERTVSDIRQWTECMAKLQHEPSCLKAYVPQQLIKGMYAGFLPVWLEVWPRNRLLLMRTEDYKAAPVAHVAATAAFLGMTPMGDAEAEAAERMAAHNVKSYSTMLNKTRDLLQDFYRPWNQRLSVLMSDDPRWTWGY
ncbi:hypothetical protein FOA52_001260 [Chlamydomonas sp. UWO 241]|nr:hypothetical protein FOA52_001260 [Chlamydomonas sp. UWO 241]